MTPLREFLLVVPSTDNTITAATTAAVASGVASLTTQSWTMQIFNIHPTVLFACFCGATIALRFLPKMNRAGMFASLFIGTIGGAYAAPLVASAIKTEHLNGIGFIMGAISHLVLTIFFNNAEKWANWIASFKTGGDK